MCTRLHTTYNNNVMMYLKLREEGCDKDSARQFCSKQFCQIDQTQSFVGPPGHKILKIQPDRLVGSKGWQPGFLMKYDLGIGYKDSSDLNEKFTAAEQAILKQYKQYENKKNAALLQKMLAVKKYADSLRAPNIDVFSKVYLQRVRQITSELRESQSKPKKFFEFGDMKFYALVDYMNKYGSNKDSMHFKFDPVLHKDIKFKTESTPQVNTARAFRRMGTISNIEREANFIMALQQQAPLGEDVVKKQKSEVVQLLKLNHQKIDLAEEFNSTQYLFTPTNAQTQVQSQGDDDAVKSFVQQFYQKQYHDKSTLSIPNFKRNIRVRTQIDSKKSTPRQPTNKIKTQSI